MEPDRDRYLLRRLLEPGGGEQDVADRSLAFAGEQRQPGLVYLSEVFPAAALLVATGRSYAAVFGAAGSNALVLLLLDLHHYGIVNASIFYGLWLIPLGYLVFKSGMFPKALGVLLVVGGACYLVGVLAVYLSPASGEAIKTLLIYVPTVAEVWLLGYLLAIGVRTPRPTDGAPVAV
jgi:hypothetical protein